VIVEVRSVDDDDQSVGSPLTLLLAEKDVAGDGLVGARRIEAVGPGEIDQLDRPAVGEGQPGAPPSAR
jgi:hypothetical protein